MFFEEKRFQVLLEKKRGRIYYVIYTYFTGKRRDSTLCMIYFHYNVYSKSLQFLQLVLSVKN